MAESRVARKRHIQCRNKMKTGCVTCRIRKVRCDENKPFCQKCVVTGRTCDGYESPFRLVTSQSMNNSHLGGIKSGTALQSIQRPLTEIAPQDVDLLNRYFSTKTIFDVKLGCDEEARQVLRASLTDPPIRHAVSSLKALREHLEAPGDGAASVSQQTSNYGHEYGLQQYCMALGGLASNLSSPGPNGLKSALLCCQVFISIEQVRENYATMAQHIIQGLRIMHEYRARPNFGNNNKLVPANHGQLPLLDVFIIKLFAAPCQFAESPATAEISSGMASPLCPMSPHQQTFEPPNLRTIAPDMRTELTRIAASTLGFLGKMFHVESPRTIPRLLSEKVSLLDSLESWLVDLELGHSDVRLGPVSESFMRFFHQILKIILLGALDSSSNIYAELQKENDRLQGIACDVDARVKAYRACSVPRSGRGEPS